MVSTIIDDFIYPNLCDEDELSFQVTIQILQELQSTKVMPISQIILILEILLCYLKTTSDDEISLHIIRCYHEVSGIVHGFVNAIQGLYEEADEQVEKDGIVNFVKQLLQDHGKSFTDQRLYLTWTKFHVDKISRFSWFLLLFNNRSLFHNNGKTKYREIKSTRNFIHLR